MSDAEERERRGLERLMAAVGKSDDEVREEREIIARFRARSRDLRGPARSPEVRTFLLELVEMKVRRTPGPRADELRVSLIAALCSPQSMQILQRLVNEPTIEA